LLISSVTVSDEAWTTIRKDASSSELEAHFTSPSKSGIAMVGLWPNAESIPVANARTMNVLVLASITYRTVVAGGVPTVDKPMFPLT
jgi:hypothetical protein